ncbi:hypothetical protein HS1genome_1915 [Sulfodiicoccus acidiphilus]|uniref:Uncharacterized protein n=1 Tax=Sulfodiicoccus acidiphilus TaxID=1670455 RepID=A0A348B5S4_9CREN|nr:hypothetical protein [Sulfodiicoccus acidiphilus]BBD73526.1 hypothetical protein HS1genome_1915 [Sulfodiicoccus acidiphilus]GGT92531.1 hypothetical protein GCM10007116_07850 [Sulfodiicoccus acidiphilus]
METRAIKVGLDVTRDAVTTGYILLLALSTLKFAQRFLTALYLPFWTYAVLLVGSAVVLVLWLPFSGGLHRKGIGALAFLSALSAFPGEMLAAYQVAGTTASTAVAQVGAVSLVALFVGCLTAREVRSVLAALGAFSALIWIPALSLGLEGEAVSGAVYSAVFLGAALVLILLKRTRVYASAAALILGTVMTLRWISTGPALTVPTGIPSWFSVSARALGLTPSSWALVAASFAPWGWGLMSLTPSLASVNEGRRVLPTWALSLSILPFAFAFSYPNLSALAMLVGAVLYGVGWASEGASKVAFYAMAIGLTSWGVGLAVDSLSKLVVLAAGTSVLVGGSMTAYGVMRTVRRQTVEKVQAAPSGKGDLVVVSNVVYVVANVVREGDKVYYELEEG